MGGVTAFITRLLRKKKTNDLKAKSPRSTSTATMEKNTHRVVSPVIGLQPVKDS